MQLKFVFVPKCPYSFKSVCIMPIVQQGEYVICQFIEVGDRAVRDAEGLCVKLCSVVTYYYNTQYIHCSFPIQKSMTV